MVKTDSYDQLFKYRSLAGDEDIDHVADIFVNERLYCAPPSSFNDPFDCRYRLSFHARREQKVKRAMEVIRRQQPSTSRTHVRRQATQRWRDVEKAFKSGENKIDLDEWGLCTLSEVNDDILMWSHYADSHRGICIGFTCRDVSHVDLFAAFPVEYLDGNDIPEINLYTTPREQIPRLAFLQKARHWSYEKERRILQNVPTSGRYFKLAPNAISHVLLGAKISEHRLELVRKWLAGYGSAVELWQARRDERKYALQFDLLPE